MMTRAAVTILFLFASGVAMASAETITRGSNLAVDASTDSRLLMDLAGEAWVVPLGGGEAQKLFDEQGMLQRPRWSPNGSSIVYATSAEGSRKLWIHELATGKSKPVANGGFLDLHPAWHPGGERLVLSSDRRDSGLDIWEVDLPTGLQWRLSSRSGDETEPAWSRDGRDLIYIHRDGDRWSLVLRRHGQPDEIVVTGNDRLAGPSWRPDGSLITFWRDGPEGRSLDMVILSQPRLVRQYMNGEDFATAPVSWLDKHRMFYSAGGLIRQRLFNSWSSRTVPFRATVEAATVVERVRRSLPRIDEPVGTLVIHAARLFDGVSGRYQRDRDIIIDGGRIRAVEAHTDRPGQIVIDLGDLAVLPGLVDVQARLPKGVDASTGPLLLAAGVTTVVTDHAEAGHLSAIWSGKELPGPRLLDASDWTVDEYSGLADSQTPGLQALLDARAARLFGFEDIVARRFSEPPSIDHGVTDVVLGSRPNGLPAGIALHAELRALAAAGLSMEQALRAAGVNAAAALGVDPNLGRVATGAVADLILVDGNPLLDVADTVNIVAVVRNGRFFSVAGLIERAEAAKIVE